MIPEAAAEAAAKGAYASQYSDAFDKVSPAVHDEFVEMARAALEAAAPHMLAAAFDEAAEAFGEAASWSDSNPSPEQVQRWLRSRANTYRPTP